MPKLMPKKEKKKENIHYVFGIDVSTHTIGCAIFGKNGEHFFSDAKELGNGTLEERTIIACAFCETFFLMAIENLYSSPEKFAIVIEEIPYGRKNAGTVSMGFVQGALWERLSRIYANYHILSNKSKFTNFYRINVSSWRKYFCDNGKVTKEEVLAMVQKKLKIKLTSGLLDEAEAIGIAMGWLKKEGYNKK